jgi:uncharacterized protein (TIGR02118 family)
MTKLIAIYKKPADPAAFDAAYFDTHAPLIKKLPALQALHVTKATRTLVGDEVYMVAQMHFADKDALKAALKSPEMAAAGANLDSFAKGLYTLLIGEEA